jgi:hypothetical protein
LRLPPNWHLFRFPSIQCYQQFAGEFLKSAAVVESVFRTVDERFAQARDDATRRVHIVGRISLYLESLPELPFSSVKVTRFLKRTAAVVNRWYEQARRILRVKNTVALCCLFVPFLRPAKMPIRALARWNLVGAGAVAFFEGFAKRLYIGVIDVTDPLSGEKPVFRNYLMRGSVSIY